MMGEAAHAWKEQDVSVERDGRLHGTLTLPDTAARVPGVLIVVGSGPVNRDGNLPGMPNDSLKLLARGLAACGIASVRADKRAVGASTWAGLHEQDLRLGDYVRDAIAWAAMLRAAPQISRVSLVGHNEGALVVSLAAQRAEADRVVLLGGAAIPAGPLMERLFSAGGLSHELQRELRRILLSLAAGKRVGDVPPQLSKTFRPTVQPYLMSWLPIDPVFALSRVQAPVLVVQGTTDIQVSVADARILAAARPGTQLALVEGMNHVLRAAPMERAANVVTYKNPALPLHPGLLPPVAAFLIQ